MNGIFSPIWRQKRLTLTIPPGQLWQLHQPELIKKFEMAHNVKVTIASS